MFSRANTLVRRVRGRTVALSCVLVLGGVVTVAHTTVDDHHAGQTVAICLAIGVGAIVAASSPRLGRLLPSAPRPRDAALPGAPALEAGLRVVLARGDPAVLQVFRR